MDLFVAYSLRESLGANSRGTIADKIHNFIVEYIFFSICNNYSVVTKDYCFKYNNQSGTSIKAKGILTECF
jgi:hypothetical protein